jgi:hypothetical protein
VKKKKMKMHWMIFCLALAVVLLACASPAAAKDITISTTSGPSESIPGGT